MAIRRKRALRTNKRVFPKELINERIRFPEVFVVFPDMDIKRKMATMEARRLAKENNLDLVVISPKGNPPIAKIIDYGKFKYDKQKQERSKRQNQVIIENREVRITPNIGEHDILTKVKKAREFLNDGNNVKISLKFSGREMQFKENGYETINKFFKHLSDLAKIDKEPLLNGRFLDMYVSSKLTKAKKSAKITPIVEPSTIKQEKENTDVSKTKAKKD